MTLQLLVVLVFLLPICVSVQQELDKECKTIVLEKTRAENCTQATKVQLVGGKRLDDQGREMHTYTNLRVLNELVHIDSAGELTKFKHFSSLMIRDSNDLIFTAEDFLPSLQKITRHPNATSAVVLIRNNRRLCIPEDFQKKLKDLTPNADAYIQKCSCETLNRNTTRKFKPSEFENETRLTETVGIVGGDDCEVLYGDLVLLERGLTQKMRRQLKNVTVLYGRLVMIQTPYKNGRFLKKLRRVVSTNPDMKYSVVHIYNNSRLEALDFFLDDVHVENSVKNNIYIRANPVLKMDHWKQSHYRHRLGGDMGPLDHRPVHIDISTPSTYAPCKVIEPILKNREAIKHCGVVQGNIYVDQTYDEQDFKDLDDIFGDVYVLYGCVTIRGYNGNRVRFLHSLKHMRCDEDRPPVIIEDNPRLERLEATILDFNLFGPGAKKQPNPNVTDITIRIRNNPRLCRTEVEKFRDMMKVRLRKYKLHFDYDGWNDTKRCYHLKETYPDLTYYFYATAAAILVLGSLLIEVVIRLVKRSRLRRALMSF